MHLEDPLFWTAVLQIIWINILLSGDNAVVIAMACRSLPERQRFWGMVLGAGAATVLRILFTGVEAQLMQLPYLKLGGGLALLWIAVKLVVPDEASEDSVEGADSLWRAMRIVVIADIIMSLDNVLAIAAAAKGNNYLILFGLLVSIPLVVAGSSIVMKLLERFSWMVWAGAALLGWIAGEMMIEDTGLTQFIGTVPHNVVYLAAAFGALLVIGIGYALKQRQGHATSEV